MTTYEQENVTIDTQTNFDDEGIKIVTVMHGSSISLGPVTVATIDYATLEAMIELHKPKG